MITQNHLHAAVMLFGKSQGFQGLRAAINNIADQPKGVRTMIKSRFWQATKSARQNSLECLRLRNVPLLLFSVVLIFRRSQAQAV